MNLVTHSNINFIFLSFQVCTSNFINKKPNKQKSFVRKSQIEKCLKFQNKWILTLYLYELPKYCLSSPTNDKYFKNKNKEKLKQKTFQMCRCLHTK